jgi:hypothetical protein
MLKPTAVYQGNLEDPHNGWPTLKVGLLSGPAQQRVSVRQKNMTSNENLVKSKRN